MSFKLPREDPRGLAGIRTEDCRVPATGRLVESARPKRVNEMSDVDLKRLVADINGAPTMMVVVRDDVICKPATLEIRVGGPVIWYYRYHGQLSGWVVADRKDVRHWENAHGVHVEGVVHEGSRGDYFDQTVVPYLTEYDFMEPEDMPEWAAMLWVKFQETRMREGKFQLRESIALMKRVRELRERMGDEGRVLRVADSRYEGKEGRTEEGEDDYDH